MKYGKVRFISKYNGNTSGIVLTNIQQQNMTISEISKLFPYSESLKMERLERSEYFTTWEEAFNFNMDDIYR